MHFVPIYILILGFTIVVDYFAGILIEGAQGRARKWLLGGSIVANVGVLVVFKYFNFINGNLAALAELIGWNYSIANLAILLPIGLSFHTFQAMSYTIEVYRGHQKAERHFGIYALYVMFYPQLVAGPIERPQNLIHQFHERHDFDYNRVVSGLKLMAWGLFKKIVVADRLALVANAVFENPDRFKGPSLLVGTVAFCFQILYDFSGYSDIAIGSARVMGFSLMDNFDRPYSARSIAEFWRRWHISLSTWFKDYIYIPLGGNRVSRARWYGNMILVFLISGLWHGANWTYIVWGTLHGVFLVIGNATENIRARLCAAARLDKHAFIHDTLCVLTTFSLVNIGWIFFRAKSIHDAWGIVTHLNTGWVDILRFSGLREVVHLLGIGKRQLALCVIGVLIVEGIPLLRLCFPNETRVTLWPWWLRWSFYYCTASALFFLYVEVSDQFIYFQF
jgi:D-alanyl-lipoteichoic acid acyltransferase DltB (MBOAT superfamily)